MLFGLIESAWSYLPCNLKRIKAIITENQLNSEDWRSAKFQESLKQKILRSSFMDLKIWRQQFCHVYTRYLMLKTEDLKTASFKSVDSTYVFMYWEPHTANLYSFPWKQGMRHSWPNWPDISLSEWLEPPRFGKYRCLHSQQSHQPSMLSITPSLKKKYTSWWQISIHGCL